MAELNVGEHCSASSCKQLDFLPIRCAGCGQVFCKEHSPWDKHDCSQANIRKEHEEYTGPKGFSCDLAGCSNRELTAVVCEACGKNFCLKHRHQVDHSCSKYQAPPERMTNTKAHIDSILASKSSHIPKKGRGRKSKATAAKVALMKMKMHGVGEKNIPDVDRIFLEVKLPQRCSTRSKVMYFSKNWALGRIIDSMARLADIQFQEKSERLRLFESDTGRIYNDMERTLAAYGQLEESAIFSGSSVLLEYVESDVLQLTDVHKYLT